MCVCVCVSHDCHVTAGYRMRFFDQAAVFTEACLEYGVLPRTKETCILFTVNLPTTISVSLLLPSPGGQWSRAVHSIVSQPPFDVAVLVCRVCLFAYLLAGSLSVCWMAPPLSFTASLNVEMRTQSVEMLTQFVC